jgi:acetyl-CoA C-acetyltransferase
MALRTGWMNVVSGLADLVLVVGAEKMTEVPTSVATEIMGRGGDAIWEYPADIDVATVHDCFTIAEIVAYEDLGFCERGEGGRLIEAKESYCSGRIPVNLDGGLKSKGHPLGATGVSMAIEITKQLRGEAGERQVRDAEIGLTHNVGGTGQVVAIHIFRRE